MLRARYISTILVPILHNSTSYLQSSLVDYVSFKALSKRDHKDIELIETNRVRKAVQVQSYFDEYRHNFQVDILASSGDVPFPKLTELFIDFHQSHHLVRFFHVIKKIRAMVFIINFINIKLNLFYLKKKPTKR